jgi:hypothetical protein
MAAETAAETLEDREGKRLDQEIGALQTKSKQHII